MQRHEESGRTSVLTCLPASPVFAVDCLCTRVRDGYLAVCFLSRTLVGCLSRAERVINATPAEGEATKRDSLT